MFGPMNSKVFWAGVLLVAAVSGVCLAETININPHKIVLNAKGAADDVQANVHIVLPGVKITDFDVTLLFNREVVAEAKSARYCLLDNILIIGFDRTDLQNNEVVQKFANQTVIAEIVDGRVTVINAFTGLKEIVSFSGSDKVKIFAPGEKKKKR